jgi:adenylate cyclase
MDSNVLSPEVWISSREIIDRSGISRATLNNYIKMGILPRPSIRSPRDKSTGAKKIGYFPAWSLDRVLLVQRMKREGMSMEAIVQRLRGEVTQSAPPGLEGENVFPAFERTSFADGAPGQRDSSDLTLTFEGISFPAYLLSHDFEIIWMNREVELNLFKGTVVDTVQKGSRNIFKLLFNWEFHNLVANWRNLVALHMAYAKTIKAGRTWISRLYRGISEAEISILEETYDHVSPVPRQTIRDSYLSLLGKDGASESYKVTSLLSRQGILFVYVPMEHALFWHKP